MDWSLLQALIPAVGGGVTLLSGLRFVQESQRGIKLRFGRAIRHKSGPLAGRPRVIQPGFVFLIPSVHSLRRIHVRTQTLAVAPQQIMLADHTVFKVGALVIMRIRDNDEGVYQSLFEIDDVDKSVEEYCAAALRDVLATMRYHEMADPARIACEVRSRVETRLSHWGVQVDDITLTDCSPAPETARMILIETEAAFRAAALLAAAIKLHPDGVSGLDPSVSAALIGTPVSVALGVQATGGASKYERNYSEEE